MIKEIKWNSGTLPVKKSLKAILYIKDKLMPDTQNTIHLPCIKISHVYLRSYLPEMLTKFFYTDLCIYKIICSHYTIT